MEEIELKSERRSKAKERLDEMVKSLDLLKKNRNGGDFDGKDGYQDHGKDGWGVVKGNIALKNGDFPGSKDISRMRDAIVNRAKDAGVN